MGEAHDEQLRGRRRDGHRHQPGFSLHALQSSRRCARSACAVTASSTSAPPVSLPSATPAPPAAPPWFFVHRAPRRRITTLRSSRPSLAFVPFIVLSADRPTELQSCAAPQTLDQVKLFGDHVRKFFDLGQPDSEDGALRACRRMVGQAVFLATSPTPGPVHLNARARKPLEPSHPSTDEERGLRERVDRLLAAPITRAFAPSRAPQVDAVATVAERLARAERRCHRLWPGGHRPAWGSRCRLRAGREDRLSAPRRGDQPAPLRRSAARRLRRRRLRRLSPSPRPAQVAPSRRRRSRSAHRR